MRLIQSKNICSTRGRILVLTSSVFDFPAGLPALAIYCNAQLEDASRLPVWQLPWPDNEKTPMVLISLSIIYQAQESLIRRLLHAAEDFNTIDKLRFFHCPH